jgi:hypothetical protein
MPEEVRNRMSRNLPTSAKSTMASKRDLVSATSPSPFKIAAFMKTFTTGHRGWKPTLAIKPAIRPRVSTESLSGHNL